MGIFTGSVKLMAKGSKGAWNILPNPVKNLAIFTALAGAGAGLVTYDMTKSHGHRFKASDVAVQPIPELLTAQDLIAATTPSAMAPNAGPADGRGVDDFQKRILAERGQTLAPSQPQQSVIAPENVQQLGGPNTPTV